MKKINIIKKCSDDNNMVINLYRQYLDRNIRFKEYSTYIIFIVMLGLDVVKY